MDPDSIDRPDDQNEHYFTATSPDEAATSTMRVTLAGREVEVLTAPKVFSQHRLDLGTSVLLRSVPEPPESGTFLDLGCGWGPVALTLGLLSPQARVVAVDVNDRALSLLRGSAERLDVAVEALRPEQVPTDLRFDLIWSNPPIRIGKEQLHQLLLTWLPRLSDDGRAYLVVQKHLGADSLTAWLDDQDGLRARKLASAKGFRVIEVSPSR